MASVDPLLGSISMFAGNYPPRGWAFCDGQLLPIAQYSALFSLLGTTYGGDGRTTFALPDHRGRVSIHPGKGPGLTSRKLGERIGSETTQLISENIPAHTHSAAISGTNATANATISIPVTTETGNTTEPGSGVILSLGEVAKNQNEVNAYSSETADETLRPFNAPVNVSITEGAVTVGMTGQGTPFANIQPVLGINYIIATQGVYPSRS